MANFSTPTDDEHRPVADASPSTSRDTRKHLECGEVMRFPSRCSNCAKQAELTMHTTNIPHFKELILMSIVCEHCGFKTNETKAGGGIPEYGSRITLKVQGPEDLNREVLKSDSAGIAVPELELELAEGGLEGFYTTVEGLLVKLLQSLETVNPCGSSSDTVDNNSTNDGGENSSPRAMKLDLYRAFLKQLKSYAEGNQFPFTIVITDPLEASFIFPRSETRARKEGSEAHDDRCTDPGITVEHFQRSHEQNEMFGLNDLNVATESISNNSRWRSPEDGGPTKEHPPDAPLKNLPPTWF